MRTTKPLPFQILLIDFMLMTCVIYEVVVSYLKLLCSHTILTEKKERLGFGAFTYLKEFYAVVAASVSFFKSYLPVLVNLHVSTERGAFLNRKKTLKLLLEKGSKQRKKCLRVSSSLESR